MNVVPHSVTRYLTGDCAIRDFEGGLSLYLGGQRIGRILVVIDVLVNENGGREGAAQSGCGSPKITELETFMTDM